MNSKFRFSIFLALIGAMMAFAAMAPAQTQDYPTAKGTNQRTGNNGQSLLDNPGYAHLQWYFPNASSGLGPTILRDNTSSEATFIGTWLAPIVGNEATGYYQAALTGVAATDALTGAAIQEPPYVYSYVVPSSTTDPTVAAAGFTLSEFNWQFTPPDNTARDYALYAWLPTGPTIDASGNYIYPPQYFVYEIDYGTGQHYIDIVDRTLVGSGFFRLGNGGNTSSVTFRYDGVTPIRLHLLNTVPRDANGNLSGVALDSSGNLLRSYLVYADAAQAQPDYGSFSASPVLGTALTGSVLTKVFGAYNRSTSTITATGTTVFTSGTLTAFDYALGTTIWNFQSVNTTNPATTLLPPGANVTVDPTWTLGPTSPVVYQGTGFYRNTITNNAATTTQVTYSPNLSAGSYAVQIWTPGEATFGSAVQVEVDLGGTAVYIGTLDLTQTTGFVPIPGTYDNEQATPITVKITNYSALTTDAGKSAFANSVQFVGAQTPLMTSTPIHATVNIQQPNGTLAMTSVVISADESGRLYCLDSAGNGDQTTHVYWTYPSLLSPDPNNSATAVNPNGLPYPAPPDGANGATIAQMPTGFNLSSGLVQEVPVGSGNYYLYICSTNGRVYCINMAGNGDYVAATQTAGSTSRVWSYPNDYPAAAKASILGSFTGSIVYNANTAGPTVFLPTAQGRMYALDAVGNGPALRTTNVRWSFPANTSATLGAINTTPAIANNSIYFGTEILNGTPGQFISLDCNSGALKWYYQGGTEGQTLNWEGGPATAFNNEIGDNTNYIFASNQNGYIYAFDDSGNVKWLTNELNVGVTAPLMFTQLQVFDNAGDALGPTTPISPIVMVPTSDGNFYGLYANPLTTNRIGTKLAYGYTADGDNIVAGMASGHQFMYGADNHGFLYAFSSLGGAGGGIGGPGATVGTPNDPDTQQFNNMTVGFLTPVAYKALRQAQVAGNADYNTFTATGEFVTRKAFDFGETLYVMVYNFPYTVTNGGAAATAPPTINFTFSVFGTTYRSVPVESRKWDLNAPTGEDGYAVLGFTLQNAGTSALSPGSGKVSFTVGSTTANGRAKNYFLDSSQTQAAFNVANPIGIAMSLDGTQLYGTQTDSLGASTVSYADPSNTENTFNGTLAGTPTGMTFSPAALGTSFNILSHASSGAQTIYVYDRSMLALINGPDIGGISNVRVDRPDLAWNGGFAQVVNPIVSLYPTLTALQTFEDYPTNFPNDSLDYPNIARQHIRVTKEPNGSTQNPVAQATSLEIPNNLFIKDANGNNTTQPNPNALTQRSPVPTPVEFDLDVPRYQPANIGSSPNNLGGLFTTSAGNVVQNGYSGSVNVFLDSNNNGKLDSTSGRVEAYRVFNLGTGVDIDKRINVITPNVDLGSLTGGNGMRYIGNDVTSSTVSQPYAFYNDPSNISPWFAGASIFHSFQASNEGNVNLLNVRVAHRYNNANNYTLWPIYASGNDDLSFMDANSFMFSDTDPAFAPSNSIGMTRGEVFAQKSRVSAVTGRRISTNPVRAANANLGTTGSATDSLANGNIYPVSADPQIAVAPPIGFPTGSYSQMMRLIEDSNYDTSLSTGVEAYSDPTFNLSFSIRETRLTNSSPSYTSIMSDDLVPYVYDSAAGTRKPNTQTYLDANVQPTGMRDLFGGMIAAWSSNRPAATNGTLGGPSGNYNLYFANVAGTTPNNANTASPLADLKQFQASGGNKWFNLAGPYPTQSPATVFGLGATETISTNDGAVRYGQPTFPVLGQVSPFDETQSFGQVLMAFNGSALATTPGGQRTFNELFVAPVTPSNGGAPSIGAPVAMTADPDLPKSKPSIVQVSGNQAVMFYGETGTGESRLYYTLFNNGTFTNSVVIPTGYGFQSITDPSASARTYVGADAATVAQNGRLLELTFSGKLRGRPNSEIFMTRIPTDVNGAPDMSNANKELVSFFSMRTGERATAEADRGIFRAQGVQWNLNPSSLANPNNGLPFDILVSVGTNPAVSIIDNGTKPVFDQQTGIYTITSTLMGQVYVDTQLGTVRFSSTIPGNTSQVYLTYQPKFLRISATKTSSLTRPTLVWDNRLVGTLNYNPTTFAMYDRFWYKDSAGNHAVLGGGGTSDPRNARYLMFYNRSAAGPGQSARPMEETIRFGIQLPGQIATTSSGDVNFSVFSVAGQNGPYQVDPSTGRVYFTQADEDALIRVTYNGTVATYKVGLITERTEALVPIEQAINEGQLSAFIDPFDPVAVASRRPGLVWLLWSSTRSGTSDIYFETIAPALYPISAGQ